ncbi:MAG: oligosaccharide flippase family protein, partial [Stellaceae bacterium]
SIARAAAPQSRGAVIMSRPGRPRGALNFAVTWLGFIVRLVGQLGYFLIVARALGPHDYGMVASVFALLIVFGAFAGWGSDHILIRAVTAAPERFGRYYGNALIQTAVTVLPLGLLVYGTQSVVIGMAPLALAAFALGDLLFGRLHVLATCCFMAFERGGDLLLINAAFSLIRLLACGGAIAFADPIGIGAWSEWFLAGAALSGLFSTAYVIARLGRPRWYFARGELGLGFQFCLYFAADSAFRDSDKPMIAYLAGAQAAGLYNAAFRIVDAAAMPLRAMTATFYARFFKHGHDGIERSFRFALKVLPLTLGYTLVAGIMVTFGADYLPLILGEKFRAAAPVTALLAFLPMFNGLSAVGGDILTSAGKQRRRAVVISALSLSPVMLTSVLVPRFGVTGAAYAALGNGALVAATIWLMVFHARRQAAREAIVPVPAPAPSEPRTEMRLAA